ncbi:MAG: hypothetical protein HY820_22725 [Acidobacteria bacterium]|nr:hypothetical protein [Acidobacteriota bacterium]
MSLRLPPLALLTLLICSCGTRPEWYSLPVQYAFNPSAEPRVVGSIVSMDDTFIENYVLSGVLPGDRGSSWRWANEKVELRFQLGDIKPVRFLLEFVIPHSTFDITGPVNMSLALNGQPAATMTVDKPGQKRWIVPVDPAQFDAITPVVALITVDKFYQSEHDGTKLGFMLQRAGFEQ